MNIQEADILLQLIREPYINQRILAEGSSHSLGIVNRSIKSLSEDGYLDTAIRPTEKAKKEVEMASPKRAVILAADLECVWCQLTQRHQRHLSK